MYYHRRPIKYVEYGKVLPPPLSDYDEWSLNMYGWVGHHCGYFPQIWLSRSRSSITGFRCNRSVKKVGYSAKYPKRRQYAKIGNDDVLFGFDIIKGFPLSYDHWELIMCSASCHKTLEKQNADMVKGLNNIVQQYESGEEMEKELRDWIDCGRNLDVYLKKCVFKEVDQVVVPSINLKSAKKIICHNEKQKKKLRKMGFIEDRIIIKNLTTYDW